MTFEVSTSDGKGDYDELGVADSRDEARDLVLDFVKKMVGKPVPYLTVDFAYNSVRGALVKEKVTHISQDFEGNWTLIWHVDDEIKDKLFFVHEE